LVTGKWNDPRRGRRVCGTLIKVTIIGAVHG
jgi:hypothetical protein